MYAAEALVSLDRISEAISYLSTDKVTSISPDIEGNGKKSPSSGKLFIAFKNVQPPPLR